MKTAAMALAISALIFPFTSMASDKTYTFDHISKGSQIRLEMDQFKVRIDGWSKDYVEVRLCLRSKSPVEISSGNNRIRVHVDEFDAPYWEPAIRVKVPEGSPVDLRAGSDAWVRGCKVNQITAKRVYVRDCRLPKAMSTKDFRFGFFGRSSGWHRIRGLD